MPARKPPPEYEPVDEIPLKPKPVLLRLPLNVPAPPSPMPLPLKPPLKPAPPPNPPDSPPKPPSAPLPPKAPPPLKPPNPPLSPPPPEKPPPSPPVPRPPPTPPVPKPPVPPIPPPPERTPPCCASAPLALANKASVTGIKSPVRQNEKVERVMSSTSMARLRPRCPSYQDRLIAPCRLVLKIVQNKSLTAAARLAKTVPGLLVVF